VFSNFLASISASERGAKNSVKSITQEFCESSKDYRTSPPPNVNSSMLLSGTDEDAVFLRHDDTELTASTTRRRTIEEVTDDKDKNGNRENDTSDIDPEKSWEFEPSLTEPYYSMNNSSVLSESLQETGPYVLSSEDQYCGGDSSRTKQQ
jgi:hypothetical protein